MTQRVQFGIVALCLLVFSDFIQADARAAAGEEIQPIITTAELVVGANRFAFGLLKAGKLVEGADVKLRLYDIDGGETKLAAEPRFLTKQLKT